MKDITVSLNGASDFSSSTSRWKRNNAFSVSPDVPNGFCFPYSHVHLKMQSIPSVVFFFSIGMAFFRLWLKWHLCLLCLFLLWESFRDMKQSSIDHDNFVLRIKTLIIVCYKFFSASTQAGWNSKVWWWFEVSVWQIPSRCPKLTSFSCYCLLTFWAFCEHINFSRALHKLGGIVSRKVCPVFWKRFWTVVFSSV